MRAARCGGPALAFLRISTVILTAAAVLPGTVHAQDTPVHGSGVVATGPAYTPHRIYDVAAAAFTDFEAFAARAAAADVVFFGERHGHAPGHTLQHALLQALARRGGATLSMEMFERDVAPVVTGYVSGTIDHATFAAESRPWPRFFSDYHALIEEARANSWSVIAANVPRELASLVAREGIAALDGLEPVRRAHAAAQLLCPHDAYRTRFIEEMNRHPTGTADSPEADEARSQRYYESQCLKDETMAEAIADALQSGARRPVVHVTGAFHSDHGDGIPARLLRRLPGTRMVSLTVIPVANLDEIDVAPHVARAGYLLFTLSPPPAAH